MKQLHFLPVPARAPEPPPHELARRTDPETSHAAAEAIQDSLNALQARALRIVRESPGFTARELADIERDRDPRTLNRRLSELHRKGLVRVREVRACQVTGRKASCWEATS